MVVKGGDEFQVATVAGLQNIGQGKQAVNGLFQGGNFEHPVAVALLHFPVMFELGNVVDGGLNAQDCAKFVVHLD